MQVTQKGRGLRSSGNLRSDEPSCISRDEYICGTKRKKPYESRTTDNLEIIANSPDYPTLNQSTQEKLIQHKESIEMPHNEDGQY